jgi:hypothetical protein
MQRTSAAALSHACPCVDGCVACSKQHITLFGTQIACVCAGSLQYQELLVVSQAILFFNYDDE